MVFKSGVKVFGIRPELAIAMFICDGLVDNLVITSVTDSMHSLTSLHYAGCAFDVRTRDMSTSPQLLVDKLVEALTNEYDVILEKDHIHVEFQPKRGS